MYQLSSIKLSQWCTYNYNPIDDARECDYYDPSLITLDDCEDGNPTFGWTLTPQEISKFYADVKNLTETFLLRFVDYDCCQMQVVDIDFYVGYYNLCSEPCVEECGTFPNIYYSINTNCGIGIFPKVKLACCPIY
jgi:hypothetical protein